jgi:hypothetical protein
MSAASAKMIMTARRRDGRRETMANPAQTDARFKAVESA